MTTSTTTDVSTIREIVEDWAKAVRARDYDGILARHTPDIVMFDVPPPLQALGIDAYRRTWDVFFAWSDDPVVFDITQMEVTAGHDVAFVSALMRCSGTEKSGDRVELAFRLTMGLRKTNGHWAIVHEHHSVPAS